MKQYSNTVTDPNGIAISGAQVLVQTAAGATASIYSDNGVTPATNPLTTNSLGAFSFYAADGVYTLTITATGHPSKTLRNVVIDETIGVTYAELASNANGLGASLVGIEDSGSLIAATNVESALAEVATDINTLDTGKASLAQLASTSDTALGDALVGVSRSDSVADTLHNILESYTFLRGNQTAVAGSKMKIDLLREDSTFKLEDEAGIWPGGQVYAYVGISREFDANLVSGGGEAPACAVFAFASANACVNDVVAVMGDANARTGSDKVWGANFVARSEAGIVGPKLVGVEIDVEPASGVTPSSESSGIVLNAFETGINIGIHINGIAGGGFTNCMLFSPSASSGGGALIAASAQSVAANWGIDFSPVTNFANGTVFLPNAGSIKYKSSGGATLDGIISGYLTGNDFVVGNTTGVLLLRSSLATPGLKANGDIWVEVTGTTPNRKVQLYARESDGDRLIAESATY